MVQAIRSTTPRTVSPAALPVCPAVKISELGKPRLFWNTAWSGSKSSTPAQVNPDTPQVTTVLFRQNQPVAPVAEPSWAFTVVHTFSGIGVCT